MPSAIIPQAGAIDALPRVPATVPSHVSPASNGRRNNSRPGPYLPPMPEMLLPRPTAPSADGSNRSLADPTANRLHSSQVIGSVSQNRSCATTANVPAAPPRQAGLTTPLNPQHRQSPDPQTPRIVRGQLDDQGPSSSPLLTLPPPEALGLIPETTSQRADTVKPDPFRHNRPQAQVGVPASANAPAESGRLVGSYAELDWSTWQTLCQHCGVISHKLERLTDGRWRFICVLAGNSPHCQREIEAVADSETTAVSAVLQRLSNAHPAR
ncbi:MAG: hypothetical protein RMI91_00355 [Gemmatales bacterium]|nr:hypothetical protein [Gemmatales bacterium]